MLRGRGSPGVKSRMYSSDARARTDERQIARLLLVIEKEGSRQNVLLSTTKLTSVCATADGWLELPGD
jgi:hypothetical protein